MTDNIASTGMMQASLRESRMVLERLVQWKGVEPGMIFSVMDCGLYSAAQGLSGYEGLERQLGLLQAGTGLKLSATETSQGLAVDAGGRHAWLVAEALLDLAIDIYRRKGTGRVLATNLTEPSELAVVTSIAQKHGLSAQVTGIGSTIEILVGAAKPGEPQILDRIQREGIPVRKDLWFHLLAQSSHALAEDTVISRTHTGSFIIRPDGTVEGEDDEAYEEDDLSMLKVEKLEYRR